MAEKSAINPVRIAGAITIAAVVGAALIAIYRTGETMACQLDAPGTAANIPCNSIRRW
tara:strand:+ start:774 stop:947 length:174 start_codon:yes stop_codon:yes gene_type:complete